jgi:hypothetical protein
MHRRLHTNERTPTMKNTTCKQFAATFTCAVLLSSGIALAAAPPSCSHQQPAPSQPTIPAGVLALPGAVLQQNMNEFNRCNPSSPQYQGYPCNGIVTLPDANIHFMNSDGVEISPEEFNQLNHPVPEAHGIYKNPDGTIELR